MRRKRKKDNSIKIIIFLIISITIIFLCYMFFIGNSDIIDNKNTSNMKTQKLNNKQNSTEKANKTEEKRKDEIQAQKPKENDQEEIKQEIQNNITINIELIGDEEVVINKGENYIDKGAKATDSNGNDVSNKIIVDNMVDTNEKGEYMVIYSIGKSMVVRTVIVR